MNALHSLSADRLLRRTAAAGLLIKRKGGTAARCSAYKSLRKEAKRRLAVHGSYRPTV